MRLKEAIIELERLPATLQKQLASISEAQLHFQPEGEYFSVLENVCHLRDIEIEGYCVRLKRILAEDHPRLPDINGGRLASERHYNEQPLQPALNAFIQARQANLRILEQVTESQLTRTAYLDTVGEITLSKLLELWVEHDRGHVRELEKLWA